MRLSGEPLEPLELTLPDVLDRAPEGCAAIFEGDDVSYGELRERTRAFAARLVELGVQPGDRVALLMTNRPEFLVAHYGATRAGAIVVPLSTRASAPELRLVLEHCLPVVVVAEESFRGLRLRDTVYSLAGELPALRHVLAAERIRDVEDAAGGAALPTLRPEDPALLIYTSGTTGEPKGCLHAHRSLVTNASVNADLKRLSSEDRVIASVPFFNAFGIVNCVLESFLAGATIVVQPTFEAAETLRLLERERVSVLLGTPTMWIRMAEQPGFDEANLAALRTGTMAGAPAPPDLVERWRARGCDLVLVYGLSEAPSILANGRPTPGVEVEISAGGELLARGYNQMLGYYGDEEATAGRIRDGWLSTGDLAELDPDGRIRITGRADDMLIVGGFNVHPGEIEQGLREHPDVADAAAFGVPDRELGDAPAAWVVPHRGADPTPKELRAFLGDRLARNKVPRHIRIVDELPLTANGKVQRFRMREAMEREFASAKR